MMAFLLIDLLRYGRAHRVLEAHRGVPAAELEASRFYLSGLGRVQHW
jgi:hypothetical protein